MCVIIYYIKVCIPWGKREEGGEGGGGGEENIPVWAYDQGRSNMDTVGKGGRGEGQSLVENGLGEVA